MWHARKLWRNNWQFRVNNWQWHVNSWHCPNSAHQGGHPRQSVHARRVSEPARHRYPSRCCWMRCTKLLLRPERQKKEGPQLVLSLRTWRVFTIVQVTALQDSYPLSRNREWIAYTAIPIGGKKVTEPCAYRQGGSQQISCFVRDRTDYEARNYRIATSLWGIEAIMRHATTVKNNLSSRGSYAATTWK